MDLHEITHITNIGAGTMGHAIALQFALNNYHVNLLDNKQTALNNGLQLIKNDLQTLNQAHLLKEDPQTILNRIHLSTDYKQSLKNADFVIESIIEDITIKKEVWQKVEQYVNPKTILATNTSGLSPSKIQQVLQKPHRFVVAHFWNPAQLMPLVEVVPGAATDQKTIDMTVALLNKIGKHAVALQKEALGFVGNRIQLAVLREAFHIINSNIASPQAVDEIIKYSLGRRWSLVGPIASADLGGLDVFKNISSYLYADLSNEQKTDPLLTKMVAANHLGLKSGQGFFNWDSSQAQKIVAQRDQNLLKLLQEDQEES